MNYDDVVMDQNPIKSEILRKKVATYVTLSVTHFKLFVALDMEAISSGSLIHMIILNLNSWLMF